MASNDPFAHPLINPAILTTNFDVKAMVQAINDSVTFLSAEPFQKDFKPVPYGDLAEAKTEADKIAMIRKNAATLNHPAGTARMSPADAKWGVVDPELRVKGAKGLRVVDASVFVCVVICVLLLGADYLCFTAYYP